MHDDTYVIIPVYNEAEVIGDVLAEVSKHFSNIICVNDGSVDSSASVITGSRAVLISHAFNLGAGASTQTGIDFALQDPAAKYFVTIDADGQHSVASAVNLIKHLKSDDLDIVMGSRFLGEVENISTAKRKFLKSAASFSARTTRIKLTDPHIGLRAFNRKFAKNLKITMPDFAHASELVGRIREGNYKYTEIPVTVSYSNYSKAKGQPMLNAVNIVFDLLVNKASKK